MAVMLAASQLHEKSAFSIHAHLGSRTTGLLDRTGERAHAGRVLLGIDQVEACATSLLHTTLENVWYYFRGGVVQQFAKLYVV